MNIGDWFWSRNLNRGKTTLVAWDVLADCETALVMLQEEEADSKFRVIWVAAIAQVRAIGHILHKVDAERDSRLKTIIDDTFNNWKKNREENAIFGDFIENERNSVLKQYEFGFMFGPIGVVDTHDNEEIQKLDDGLYCPILDGRYNGEDCRDVLSEALKWWKIQLSKIEKQYCDV